MEPCSHHELCGITRYDNQVLHDWLVVEQQIEARDRVISRSKLDDTAEARLPPGDPGIASDHRTRVVRRDGIEQRRTLIRHASVNSTHRLRVMRLANQDSAGETRGTPSRIFAALTK